MWIICILSVSSNIFSIFWKNLTIREIILLGYASLFSFCHFGFWTVKCATAVLVPTSVCITVTGYDRIWFQRSFPPWIIFFWSNVKQMLITPTVNTSLLKCNKRKANFIGKYGSRYSEEHQTIANSSSWPLLC